MDFILNAVTGMLNAVSAVLAGWKFTHSLGADIAKIAIFLEKANYLLPVDTALAILSLFVSLNLVLITYYAITRALNLLRGAG